MALCRAGEAFHADLVREGHTAGILAAGVTPGDFQALAMYSAIALKHSRVGPRAKTSTAGPTSSSAGSA